MKKKDTRYTPAIVDQNSDTVINSTEATDTGIGQTDKTRRETKAKQLFDLVTWIDTLYNSSIKNTACTKQSPAHIEQEDAAVPELLVNAFTSLTPYQIKLLLDIKKSANEDLTQLMTLSLESTVTFGLLPEPIKGLLWPYVTFSQHAQGPEQFIN